MSALESSSSSHLIGITGATGQLGRLVVSQLKAHVPSEAIVALVRSSSKASDLGVKAVEADYSNPNSLEKAFNGISTLLFISGSEIGQRTVQHRNVIDAAKKAGVKHIVYTSLLHADSSPLILAKEHVETEAFIKKSELSFTILRNGWYAENYYGSIPGALAAGSWIGASGDGKISAAARADYAAAAVVVITKPEQHVGQIYELAADSAFTAAQLAAEVSKQCGKTLPYHNLSQDQYSAVLVKVGLPKPVADVLADAEIGALKGGLYDDSHTLSKLIERPTTPLATAIAVGLKAHH